MVDMPVLSREDLANCEDIDEGLDMPDESSYNNLYREDNIKD
jgi:hypothetical protein